MKKVPLNKYLSLTLYLLFYGLCAAGAWYCCSKTYWSYEWLEAHFAAGLTTMFCLALVLAIVAAPGFISGMTTKVEDRPSTISEWFKLHCGVIGITLVALCAVFLCLWVVGWILEWLKFGGYLLKRWLLG